MGKRAAEPKAEAAKKAKTEASPKAKGKAKAKAEPKAKAEAKAKAEPKPKAEPKAAAEPKAEPKDTKAGAKGEEKPEFEHQPHLFDPFDDMFLEEGLEEEFLDDDDLLDLESEEDDLCFEARSCLGLPLDFERDSNILS